MAKQTINIGAAPNDGTGDPLRTAFDKANDNFDELYGALIQFQDEGVDRGTPGAVQVVDFTGAGVSATYDGLGVLTVNVSAGGGGGSPGGSNGQIQYRVDGTTFGGAPLWRESENVSAFRNGTNAQITYVYKTESASLSNYERIAFDATPSGYMRIGVESAGTGSANIGLAMTPRGTGALSAQVPDSTTAGGNARGTRSTDWARDRGAATEVASGASSTISGGTNHTASGTGATVGGGVSNRASGSHSTVPGGASNVASGNESTVGGGTSNTASGPNSTVAGGVQNTADGPDSWVPGGFRGFTRGLRAAYAYSSSSRASNGDAQRIGQPLQITTTNATPTVLTADRGAVGSTNVLVLPNNSMWTGLIQVGARDTSGNVAKWTFDVLAKRGANAASTAIVNSTTVVSHAEAALSTAAVSIVADPIQGAVTVQVTGVAATTIDWWAEAFGGQVVR